MKLLIHNPIRDSVVLIFYKRNYSYEFQYVEKDHFSFRTVTNWFESTRELLEIMAKLYALASLTTTSEGNLQPSWQVKLLYQATEIMVQTSTCAWFSVSLDTPVSSHNECWQYDLRCFSTRQICSRESTRKQELNNVIGWLKKFAFSLTKYVAKFLCSLRFHLREHIRLVENRL